MFRLGKSHFLDSPEVVARDQASSDRAIAAYQEFIARFPKDPLAADARTDLSKLEARLADKEWEIGSFYLKRGNTDAAKRRFQRLIERFSGSAAAARARRHLDSGSRAQ
jgi:outer membrane protein assembly factor BamD